MKISFKPYFGGKKIVSLYREVSHNTAAVPRPSIFMTTQPLTQSPLETPLPEIESKKDSTGQRCGRETSFSRAVGSTPTAP